MKDEISPQWLIARSGYWLIARQARLDCQIRLADQLTGFHSGKLCFLVYSLVRFGVFKRFVPGVQSGYVHGISVKKKEKKDKKKREELLKSDIFKFTCGTLLEMSCCFE